MLIFKLVMLFCAFGGVFCLGMGQALLQCRKPKHGLFVGAGAALLANAAFLLWVSLRLL